MHLPTLHISHYLLLNNFNDTTAKLLKLYIKCISVKKIIGKYLVLHTTYYGTFYAFKHLCNCHHAVQRTHIIAHSVRVDIPLVKAALLRR